MERKAVRTPIKKRMGRISMTVYMKPYDCGGGRCIYCFTDDNMPRSALVHEDTIRGERLGWVAGEQVRENYRRFSMEHGQGHKVGVNLMGGSFTNYPADYQEHFIKGVYDAVNQTESDSLDSAMRYQRQAKDKLVYIMLQALPNHIDDDVCRALQRFGVAEVQLGVQTINDEVLEINQRPHTVQDVINATALLRKYGFRVTYHLMIGMVGATSLEDEITDTIKALTMPEFSPDYFKLFPCLAVRSTNHNLPVDDWFKLGWRPLDDDDFEVAADEIMCSLPGFVGIGRIQRIVSPDRILYGPKKLIHPHHYQGRSDCIWLRSLMYRDVPTYDLSALEIRSIRQGDRGTFLVAEIGDTIYGFARVEEDAGRAVIRELSVTGNPVDVGRENDLCSGSGQHLGVGMQLLAEINKRFSDKTIVAYPPPGLYEYFVRNGFRESDSVLTQEVQPTAVLV